MKNNILGLFALVMLMLASCEKATEKEKICALKDCYLCEKKNGTTKEIKRLIFGMN
jgi:uncharacterized lipoprotein NlpE involved in copper resistance